MNSAHLFIGRVAASHIKGTNNNTYSDILDEEATSILAAANVTLHSYGDFGSQMVTILKATKSDAASGEPVAKKSKGDGNTSSSSNGGRLKVMVEGSSSMQIVDTVTEACHAELVAVTTSPIQVFKACKNEAEIHGLRQACVRDSAAVVSFLAWLKDKVLVGQSSDASDDQDMREHALGVKMSSFREAMGQFRGDSFETISAVITIIALVIVMGLHNCFLFLL